MFLYFKEYETASQLIASHLGLEPVQIIVHKFPDGESLVRLPAQVDKEVVICRSLFRPNEKLIEIMLAAQQARRLGAKKVILCAPYLCYMRQDKAFHPGEAVSQRIIGGFLSQLFDCVVTVDAHLHRVSSLREVMPDIQAVNLSAAGPIADFLATVGDRPLLLGPDEESLQWVKSIGERCSLDYAVCKKIRLGDREVEVKLPQFSRNYNRVIIIDDILSTGRTIAGAAALLKTRGIGRVDCLVTHPIFAPGAYDMLKKSGVDEIISTDTVPHETNRISVAPVIAEFFVS